MMIKTAPCRTIDSLSGFRSLDKSVQTLNQSKEPQTSELPSFCRYHSLFLHWSPRLFGGSQEKRALNFMF